MNIAIFIKKLKSGFCESIDFIMEQQVKLFRLETSFLPIYTIKWMKPVEIHYKNLYQNWEISITNIYTRGKCFHND